MAIPFKLYQDNRATSSTNSKWFGRALCPGELTLQEVCARIQENVSVKESDVMGVITELANVMRIYLLEGYTVNIERLGRFKVGLITTAADSAAEFNPVTNVQGARVNFQPSYNMVSNGTSRYKTVPLMKDFTCQETPKNDVKKD